MTPKWKSKWKFEYRAYDGGMYTVPVAWTTATMGQVYATSAEEAFRKMGWKPLTSSYEFRAVEDRPWRK